MAEEFESVYELARITVGIRLDNTIVVNVRGKQSLADLGLDLDFDRAAAAFAREFQNDDTRMVAAQCIKGDEKISPALNALYADMETPAPEQEAGGPQSTTEQENETK